MFLLALGPTASMSSPHDCLPRSVCCSRGREALENDKEGAALAFRFPLA